MVWALIIALALAAPAYADDGIEVIAEQGGSGQDPPVVEVSNDNTQESTDEKDDASKVYEDSERDRSDAEKSSKDERLLRTVEDEKAPNEISTEEPVVKALGDRASVNFTAYGNMSPSSTYALYAEGLLKEVAQDESYCLVQDSNASYAFVVGKADSLSSFSDARWWRWYSTTGYGWRLERGSGSASVNAGAYQVISNLEGYPSLVTEVQELTRREVMLYALVTACVFSLVHVWAFCIRLSRTSKS